MKFVFAKNNCLGRREFGFVISIGNIQSQEWYQKHDIISKKLDQQCVALLHLYWELYRRGMMISSTPIFFLKDLLMKMLPYANHV